MGAQQTDEHSKRLSDFGRALGEFLQRLLVQEAGLPRPIIRLNDEMPFFLPVNQDVLRDLRTFVEDAKREFQPANLMLHVQPYQDPYHRQTVALAYPYPTLAAGEKIARLDDPRPVKLARVVVPSAPKEWRSEKSLELFLQAAAKHLRHGVALGSGPIVPLRVPRQEIP